MNHKDNDKTKSAALSFSALLPRFYFGGSRKKMARSCFSTPSDSYPDHDDNEPDHGDGDDNDHYDK